LKPLHALGCFAGRHADPRESQAIPVARKDGFMPKRLVALGLALGGCVLASAAEEKAKRIAIDLGGLRQAKADVTASHEQFTIRVRMLSVTSFDAALNARLNREKARALALLALAKHLGGKKDTEFTVSGAEVRRAGADGKLYILVLCVPRKGVALVRAGRHAPPKRTAVPGSGVDRVIFTSELFTRKRDYLDTMEQLAANALRALRAAEGKANGPDQQTGDFSFAVAEIEERGLENLQKLGQEIKDDLLLLSVEQEELAAALVKHKEKLLARLNAVKRHSTETRKGKTR
jgi:hypothetical protein